jgi:hypothetical protein
MKTTACRSCGALVVWAQTERGKRAPIDASPTEGGTTVLRERPGEEAPLAIFGVPDDAFPGEPRYTSHFATCPHASDWRQRGTGAVTV